MQKDKFRSLTPYIKISSKYVTGLNVRNKYPLEGLMLKLKLQYFGHLMQTANLLEKTLMLGKSEGIRRRGRQEDEMVGWHH